MYRIRFFLQQALAALEASLFILCRSIILACSVVAHAGGRGTTPAFAFLYFEVFFMPLTPGADPAVPENDDVGSADARAVNYQLDYIASSKLPTPWAEFSIHIFVDPATR